MRQKELLNRRGASGGGSSTIKDNYSKEGSSEDVCPGQTYFTKKKLKDTLRFDEGNTMNNVTKQITRPGITHWN